MLRAIDFKFSGNVTPISNGNRALEISDRNIHSLYTEGEFRKKALAIPSDFIFEKIVPSLINLMEQNIAHRLTSAALRANHNNSIYGVKKAGITEISTEILFDPKLTKVIKNNASRESIHRKIKGLYDNKKSLSIGLPLFSRKPISPIKNRGYLPDIGDIHSLMRCAEFAKLLSCIHDYDIHLNIFADGFKYQRACGTPYNIICDYQTSLRFWAEKLGIDKYIKIINYEDILTDTLGVDYIRYREEIFLDTYYELYKNSKFLLNPTSLCTSFHSIESQLPHGQELRYIFSSIASSVFYRADNLGDRIIRKDDIAQNIFTEFMARLHVELQRKTYKHTSNKEIIEELIFETWDAALKYVAISLTDRKLNVWQKLQPNGIKLTIHGKPKEIQIKPTNSKFPAMTAQHSVGGLRATRSGAKITCEYRIEREASREIPILLENISGSLQTSSYLTPTIRKMIASEQPFCYVPANIDNIYSFLSGAYTDA